MKELMSLIAILVTMHAFSQTNVTKYYNPYWEEVPEKEATYYAVFARNGDAYDCTSYWMDTKSVRGISTQKDTIMGFPIGLQRMYDKKGHIEDSAYIRDSVLQYHYHFYPNGQLHASYVFNGSAKKSKVAGYDENGKAIKNFVFQKEAAFKGGNPGWQKYLIKNATLPKDIIEKLSKSEIKDEFVTVIVQFVIGEDGYVIKPQISASSGYPDIDKYALEIIANAPGWMPAIEYNEPVKAYRMQPIKYQVR